MRQVMFAVVFFCSAGLLNAQELRCNNKDGQCELTFVSFDAKRAHDSSANLFVREIGSKLKAYYPSRVSEPKVIFRVMDMNGQKTYSLTWLCKIVPTTPGMAHYHFDRRGTLHSGATLVQAKNEVETENKEKLKEARHRLLFKWKVPSGFVLDSYSGSDTEGWWYIQEMFLVAPR